MARKRKPSDDLYNARRRVRRAAERLAREGKSSVAESMRKAAAAGSGTTLQELDRIYNQARSATRSATVAQQVAMIPEARTPRPQRKSDEVYNARRRLKRQAANLEREAKKQPEMIAEQMRSLAKSLRAHAEAALGLKSKEEQQAAIDRLAQIREITQGASYGKSSVYRRNVIIMQQINAAGTKDADSSISEADKNVFWAAVKGLWPEGSHVPRNERYNKVIDHFYFTDTSDAKEFAAWLEKKGIDIRDVAGDLSYIFEYITTELNDPEKRDEPEMRYEDLMKIVIPVR